MTPQALADSAPFANMRFRVEIDGMRSVGACEVTFPEARIVIVRGRAAAQFGALTLRRGLAQDSEWYEWWSAARRAHGGSQRDVGIALLDAGGRELNRWSIRDARPIAYRLSGLNALGNEILMETLEVAVGDFIAAGGPGAPDGASSHRRSRTSRRIRE
jgi:T4-like virus tail tube protein gp19